MRFNNKKFKAEFKAKAFIFDALFLTMKGRKNIVLIGFMGSGKSTVGKILARKLSRKVVDTDDVIEKTAGMSIKEIFEKFGEAYFRELERKAVKKVSKLEGHIIITGGGVVLNRENMQNLRKRGIIVYLHADPEVIYERVKKTDKRPLLNVKNPIKRIKELLEFRKELYGEHDIKVDTSRLTPEEVADEIIRKMKELPS